MRYLIDTNILYFYMTDIDQLTAEVRDILDDPGNLIYIPFKCVEELVYLLQSGKIKLKQCKSAEDVIDFIAEMNVDIKYPKKEHLRTLARLPLFPDHKDPADRVIIAQAITEKVPLVSSDRKFHNYKKYGLNFVFNKR
jgi:PIN domain nuclease of toxin-antitoxin system